MSVWEEGKDGQRGREWMEYRCVTSFCRSQFAPGWLLYMEKWKCLNNHVRTLEESISWRGVCLPWGISAFSSDVSNRKPVVLERRRTMCRLSDRECFSNFLQLPTWSLSGCRVNIPLWRVGGLGLLTETYRQPETLPEIWYGLRLQHCGLCCERASPPPHLIWIGLTPYLRRAEQEPRASTCTLNQL